MFRLICLNNVTKTDIYSEQLLPLSARLRGGFIYCQNLDLLDLRIFLIDGKKVLIPPNEFENRYQRVLIASNEFKNRYQRVLIAPNEFKTWYQKVLIPRNKSKNTYQRVLIPQNEFKTCCQRVLMAYFHNNKEA
jgi:hypothetical protein